jgi:hypothetical protein
MIQETLSGRKGQTRRVLKPQPIAPWFWDGDEVDPEPGWFDCIPYGRDEYGQPIGEDTPPLQLPFATCDRLWVREAWRTPESLDHLSPTQIEQRCKELGYHGPWCPRVTTADNMAHQWSEEDGFRDDESAGRLRASMHMPRWASRITQIVTDVRVQRLQDISGDDAVAEGVDENWEIVEVYGTPNGPSERSDYRYRVPAVHDPCDVGFDDPVDAYQDLWDSINAARGFGWDTNPWVVAVTFESYACNIDRFDPATRIQRRRSE